MRKNRIFSLVCGRSRFNIQQILYTFPNHRDRCEIKYLEFICFFLSRKNKITVNCNSCIGTERTESANGLLKVVG